MRLRRSIGVAAALACAPALAHAAPIQTTLRVEGGSANVIPASPVTIDPAGPAVTIEDTSGAFPPPAPMTVPAGSATAQLKAGSTAYGVSTSWKLFSFGTFTFRIGPDQMPAAGSPSWRLTVNGKNASTGADAVALAAGDSVVWSFVTDYNSGLLDLTVSGDRFQQGGAFTATVTSTTPDPAIALKDSTVPAAGAVVTYGGQTAIADAAGRVTLRAVGQGTQQVLATRPGDVRSPSRNVCSYTDDPTVCALPAAPKAPTTATTTTDTVAPGSEITSLVSGRRYTRVVAVSGRTGADRSDVAGVEVALAMRVGTLCRFIGPRGVFGAARACIGPRFVTARSAGTRWILPLRHPLTPGKYLILSRATDGAGNRETRTLNTVNTVSLTVVPRVAR